MAAIEPIRYKEYLGAQCSHCGLESYSIRYHCSRCDNLSCSMCLEAHSERHQTRDSKKEVKGLTHWPLPNDVTGAFSNGEFVYSLKKED